MSAPLTRRQIWTMPMVLAIVSTIGLVSALVGNGVWDVLSWGSLGMPIGHYSACSAKKAGSATLLSLEGLFNL